jgi:hypothetical protein
VQGEVAAVDAGLADGNSTAISVSEPLRDYLDSMGWEKSLADARSIFIEDRGIRLHVALWEGRSEDPCIIFLHGMGLHSLFFAGFMSKLSKQGWAIGAVGQCFVFFSDLEEGPGPYLEPI